MKKIVWKEAKVTYTQRHDGHVGRLKLFTIYWDGITRNEDKWALICFISTLKNPEGNFKSIEDAKSYANTMLKLINAELK